MTRIAKLYQKLLDGRALSFSEFQKLLEAFGYIHVRTRGSHMTYRRPDIADIRVIQPKGKDAKPYQVQQFVDMIEQFALRLDGNTDEPTL
jgi:predicted RNA binding protein YcfA (HicA-like mRNA interferase family)